MHLYTTENIAETSPSNEQREKDRIAFLEAIKNPETRKEIIRLLREGGSLS